MKRDFAVLVPPYSDYKFETEADVLFLGKRNILSIAKSWEYRLQEVEGRIARNRKSAVALRGHTAADFRKMAAKYENPKDIVIGQRDRRWRDDPEPVDPKSLSREPGATTFNICGWCAYVGCGTCRYGYHISSSCNLAAGDAKLDVQRKFNTPCWLLSASTADIARVVAQFDVEHRELCAERRKLQSRVRTVERLAAKAEDKPASPHDRPHDWFNEGDRLVCYVGDWKDNRVYGPAGEAYAFAPAVVIPGYRHHDGCVSVRYDDKIHTGEYLEGHGGGYGMSRPEVMHQWEFDYLVTHPVFAAVWLRQGTPQRLEGFSADNMLAALAAHAVASKK